MPCGLPVSTRKPYIPGRLFLVESRQIERLLFCVEDAPSAFLQAIQVVYFAYLRPDQFKKSLFSALVESLWCTNEVLTLPSMQSAGRTAAVIYAGKTLRSKTNRVGLFWKLTTLRG